jgi:hypothetical protein
MRILLIIAALTVLALVLRSVRGGRISGAERRLTRKLGAETAHSLIEFEMNHDPLISRKVAAARALDRVIYDRTR